MAATLTAISIAGCAAGIVVGMIVVVSISIRAGGAGFPAYRPDLADQAGADPGR
jgi:hypothetical protein